MARICEICGKGPVTGNKVIRHGLEKKKGGIGLHSLYKGWKYYQSIDGALTMG